jgi:hypothetical protein
MRAAGLAAGSASVAALLLLAPGTAVAAPGTAAPVASTVPSEGGTGGEACAHLPVGLQELLCPSPDGGDRSGASGGSAAGAAGAATGGTGGGTAATGGTTGATAPPAAGSGAPTPAGVVSNFLIWLAGLFRSVGL